MQLALKFRNVLPTMVVEELDSIVATVRAYFGLEHKEDGTHGAIHCDSITVAGNPLTDSTGKLPNLGPTYVTEARIDGTLPMLTLDDAGTAISQHLLGDSVGNTSLTANLLVGGGQWVGDSTADHGLLLQLIPAGGRLDLYYSPAGANPRTLTLIHRIVSTGAILERGRTTAMGEWIAVPYSAANFTADIGTWTVEAADQRTYRYTLIGKTAVVSITVNGTTTSASTGYLLVRLPAGITAAGDGGAGASQNYLGGTYDSGYVIALGGTIYVFRNNRAAFPVLTNTLNITFTVTFEIA